MSVVWQDHVFSTHCAREKNVTNCQYSAHPIQEVIDLFKHRNTDAEGPESVASNTVVEIQQCGGRPNIRIQGAMITVITAIIICDYRL